MEKSIPLSQTQKEIDDWRRQILSYIETLQGQIASINSSISSLSGVLSALSGEEEIDLSNFATIGQLEVLESNQLTLPLNTKGDLLTRNNTQLMRFPVGADGQILKANDTQTVGLEWLAPDYYDKSTTYTKDEVDSLFSSTVSGGELQRITISKLDTKNFVAGIYFGEIVFKMNIGVNNIHVGPLQYSWTKIGSDNYVTLMFNSGYKYLMELTGSGISITDETAGILQISAGNTLFVCINAITTSQNCVLHLIGSDNTDFGVMKTIRTIPN